MSNINPGGEIVTCPTCGAAARTLPCRKPFVPSIECIDSIDGSAWHEFKGILKDLQKFYIENEKEFGKEFSAVDGINEALNRLNQAASV